MVPWRSWEGARLLINQHSYAQEIVSLRKEIHEMRAEAPSGSKPAEIIVIEDDVEKSSIVKKLRKGKAKLEGNVASLEAQVQRLKKENKDLCANFDKQLEQKNKMLHNISVIKAKAESNYDQELNIAREKFEEEKREIQAHYVEEIRKKDSVISQKNNVISMKQAAIDEMKHQRDDTLQDIDRRKEKIIQEKKGMVVNQGETIVKQRKEIVQQQETITQHEAAIKKLNSRLTGQGRTIANKESLETKLKEAVNDKDSELANLRLQLERQTENSKRLKEDLDHHSNNVVPSLMSSIHIKTERVNQLEGQLDSILSANLSRLHTGSSSRAGNTQSGPSNGQDTIQSNQTSSMTGYDTPRSSHRRKRRRHAQSEPEVKTE